MADKDNDFFGHLVGRLLDYFASPKNWDHTIRLYKDVPISHIRVGNPERNYIRNHEYYLQYFQEISVSKLTQLMKILSEVLNDNGIFTVEEELALLNNPEIASLPIEDIAILKNIIQLIRIMVFVDDLDENQKFKDPITVSMDSNNKMSIHPGKKRIGVLEYLYLKNNKDYFVDVIFYKNKKADLSNNHDSFLIDKEYTVIKSLDDFSKAYGYSSIAELLLDVKNIKVALCIDSKNQYYLNKYTTFAKEKFINKFPIILKMCKK